MPSYNDKINASVLSMMMITTKSEIHMSTDRAFLSVA